MVANPNAHQVTISGDLPPTQVVKKAIATPYRRLLPTTRKMLGRDGTQEYDGGIFASDGSAISTADWMRSGDFPIARPLTSPSRPTTTVAGRTLYAGPLYTRHYGHFLIESLARLWPTLNDHFDHIAFHAIEQSPNLSDFNTYFLTRLGIHSDRNILISETTLFHDLVVPEPFMTIGGFTAYRVLGDIYRKVRGEVRPLSDTPPCYLSRTRFPMRRVYGEPELEQFLQSQGWRIVHPETISAPSQVKIAGEHEHFCGVVGSAMHNAIFAADGASCFYIQRNRRQASTMRTLAALDDIMGIRATYIEADIAQTPDAFLIDVRMVLDQIHSCGLIDHVPTIDQERINKQFEEATVKMPS